MDDHSSNKDIVDKTSTKPIPNVTKTYMDYSMRDLKRLVEIKYTHYSEFGRKMGWSRITVCSVLNSHWIPSDPVIIKKMAIELGINEIKLTQLFGRTEKRGKEE